MRHQKFSQRLSRPMGHRKATLRNLMSSLIKYQRIRTTLAKAKFAQSSFERLVSLAKQGSLQSRRQAYRILNNKAMVKELFSHLAPLFKNRNSGFSRIIRYTQRHGDGAQLVFLELTEKTPKAKPAKPTKTKKEPEEAKPKVASEEKTRPLKEMPKPPKELKPKKFLGGLRSLFKKERDSL